MCSVHKPKSPKKISFKLLVVLGQSFMGPAVFNLITTVPFQILILAYLLNLEFQLHSPGLTVNILFFNLEPHKPFMFIIFNSEKFQKVRKKSGIKRYEKLRK